MLNYTPNWNRQSTSTGYKVVHCPDHPRAWKTGYVYVHIIVAEEKIGRLLKDGEVVHHKDENKFNNNPENLEVLTKFQHSKLHHAVGLTLVHLVCKTCNKSFKRRKGNEPTIKKYKNAFCGRKCFWKSLERGRQFDSGRNHRRL